MENSKYSFSSSDPSSSFFSRSDSVSTIQLNPTPRHIDQSTGSLTFEQINLASRSLSLPALELWMNDSAPCLVAVIEAPWHLRNNGFRSNRHIWLRSSPQGESLCGLFIREDINFSVVSVSSPSPRVIAITVHTPAGLIGVISFYVQHTSGNGLEAVDEAFNLLKRKTDRILLLGDGNGHSYLWGPEHPNEIGRLWEDFISANQLVVASDPSGPPTFFDQDHRPHWLDITLATAPLSKSIVEWRIVHSAIPVSDHSLVKTTLNLGYQKIIPRRFTNWRDVDWPAFNEHLEKILSRPEFSLPMETQDQIDERIDMLTSALQKTASQFTRTKSIQGHSKPWFTQSVKLKWKNMKRARNRYIRAVQKAKRHPMSAQLEVELATRWKEAREARASFKKEVRLQKKNSFVKFCSDMKSDMWNGFAKIDRSRKRSQPAQPPEDHKSLEARFFPDEGKSVLGKFAEDFRIARRRLDFSPGEENTWKELVEAIIRSKDGAPGPDSIPSLCLRNTLGVTGQVLLPILNAALSLAYFPKAWKKASVIPLPKPDKDLSLVSSWRPICLLNTLGKVLERVLQRRLYSFLEEHGCLVDQQFGFRRARSTESALTWFAEDIIRAFNSHSQIGAVSLDLTAAFDTVPHPILMYRLGQLNIPAYLWSMVDSFLVEREATISLPTSSIHCRPVAGVPQGSCLSPTLFLCFVNSLANSVPPEVKCCLFADDCLLYCQIGPRGEGQAHLESSLKKAVQWATLNGMQFNANKSHLVRFSRLRKATSIQVNLDGSLLQEEPQFRHLMLHDNTPLPAYMLQHATLLLFAWPTAPMALQLVQTCLVYARLGSLVREWTVTFSVQLAAVGKDLCCGKCI